MMERMKTDIRLTREGKHGALTGAHRGTVKMRLFSRALGDAGPLDRFIAARRVPGDNWLRWIDIAAQITELTDAPVTGESVRQWAMALGVPEDTRKNDDALKRGEFLRVVSEQGIPYT
jgi:hypothetical protein